MSDLNGIDKCTITAEDIENTIVRLMHDTEYFAKDLFEFFDKNTDEAKKYFNDDVIGLLKRVFDLQLTKADYLDDIKLREKTPNLKDEVYLNEDVQDNLKISFLTDDAGHVYDLGILNKKGLG